MKNRFWLFLFLLILVAHLAGIYFNNQTLQIITKPVLIIVLITYIYSLTKIQTDNLKKWVFSALFFSWLGDVLLMFQPKNEIFFLLGLSAFLIAHIFYIIFFHNIRLKEKIKAKWFLLVIVVVYYAILITVLSPYLGKMKLPVRIYGIVISIMFMLSMHMLSAKNKKAGLFMMTGALLFVLSDSFLAINKFYQSFELAGVIIMLTYGLAQLFITEGAIRYVRQWK